MDIVKLLLKSGVDPDHPTKVIQWEGRGGVTMLSRNLHGVLYVLGWFRVCADVCGYDNERFESIQFVFKFDLTFRVLGFSGYGCEQFHNFRDES